MGTRTARAARRRGHFVALAVVLALHGRGLDAQVAVDELELHVVLRPGATSLTQTFHAANTANSPANATIALQDWDRSEGGENRYYPLGTLPSSCGSHVTVLPSVLFIDARSAQTVRVTIDSADAIPRGCYTILFVETPPSTRGPSASGLAYSVRYGIKLYVERETPPTGEVTAVSIERRGGGSAESDGGRQLTFAFHNSGGRQTMTHGSVEVRRLDDSVAAKIDVPEFPTLPGATRRLAVPLPTLPKGRYVLLALLDYGGQEIAAGQVSLEVP
ncbi:MAG TPA: hypothetical protein VLN49_20245 [Gemmatimonadaceae bacterium]|nr:hypothetical protein [Gemmatimonadaceae bacterium]